jgi:pimeloyl-ACP methyl ester carboxylesterase
MTASPPHCRDSGTGPGVICLHASASTSGQWRGLIELLAPTFHVHAPDLYDAGNGPHWPSQRVIGLRDELALIEPVLAKAGSPLALVGHSYGAAVALIAALSNPDRVRALVLYEPTLFALLDATLPASAATRDIRSTVADVSAALDAGDGDGAAARFVDYWTGAGTWKRMPEPRKAPIVASVSNARRWAHALFTEPTPLAAFRSLTMPVLCLTGTRSPASALGVTRLLMATLPHVELIEFEDLGHMGPVTDPATVNGVIAEFVEQHLAFYSAARCREEPCACREAHDRSAP